jgi:hypothetical protein
MDCMNIYKVAYYGGRGKGSTSIDSSDYIIPISYGYGRSGTRVTKVEGVEGTILYQYSTADPT